MHTLAVNKPTLECNRIRHFANKRQGGVWKFQGISLLSLSFCILLPHLAWLSPSHRLSSCTLCQSIVLLIVWLSAKPPCSCTTVIGVWKHCHAPWAHTQQPDWFTGWLAGCFTIIGGNTVRVLNNKRSTGGRRRVLVGSDCYLAGCLCGCWFAGCLVNSNSTGAGILVISVADIFQK